MKLNILSDLHLGFGALDTPLTDADVVVLAGDIAALRQAASWAMRFEKPVLYVLGNHEFYGGSIANTADELKRLCAGTHVHVLDDDEILIGGVRFLGTTLWTDFKLFGDGDQRDAAIEEARRLLRDFSRIRIDDASNAPFTPADSAALFARHAAWLERRLDTPHDGPTVVVSHHAPSPRSIHPRFKASLLNACFVSDAEHLVGGDRAPWWIHGHTHDRRRAWRLPGHCASGRPRRGGDVGRRSRRPDFERGAGRHARSAHRGRRGTAVDRGNASLVRCIQWTVS